MTPGSDLLVVELTLQWEMGKKKKMVSRSILKALLVLILLSKTHFTLICLMRQMTIL